MYDNLVNILTFLGIAMAIPLIFLFLAIWFLLILGLVNSLRLTYASTLFIWRSGKDLYRHFKGYLLEISNYLREE